MSDPIDVVPARVRRVILAGAIPGRVVRSLLVVIDGRRVCIDVDESAAQRPCPQCRVLADTADALRSDLMAAEARIADLTPSLIGRVR